MLSDFRDSFRSDFVLANVYQLSEVTPLRGAVVGTAHAQTLHLTHLTRIWFVRTRSAPGVGRAVCAQRVDVPKVNRTEGDAVPVGFAVDDTRYRWPEKAELAHARPFFHRAPRAPSPKFPPPSDSPVRFGWAAKNDVNGASQTSRTRSPRAVTFITFGGLHLGIGRVR